MAPKLTDYLIQQEAQSKVTEAYEAVFHTKYLRKSFEEVLQQHKEFNGVHGVQQGQIDVEDTVVNTALITDILSLRRIRDQGLKDAKTELSQLSHDICAQMQLFAPESSAVEHEDVAITRQVRRAVAVFQHKTHGVQTSAEVEGLEHTLTQAVHSTLRASELYSLDKLQELMGDLREEWTLPVMVERLMRVAEDLKAAKQRIARRDGALERRKQQHDTTLKESNEISAAYEKLKGRYEELGKTRTHLQQRIGQLETERATMMTKTEHQQRLTEAGDHIRESAKTRAEETESQHAKGLSELEARLSEKHASAVKALNRRIGDAQLRTISADSGRDVWKRQAEEHRRSLLDEQTDRRTEAGLRAQGDEHKNTLIKELQVRIDEKNNQIDQLRKHNDTLDSNAVELKQRLELEQGEYLGARAEMEAFKASAGQQRLKDDAAISALTVERDGLRSRLQKLEEDCKLRDTQIEELGCKLSTTAEGEAEWKSKAEAAETVCKESTDQRDDLRASLVAARSQADTLMHEVNGHVKSVSNADGMLREKRQALADTLRKLGDTQRQLATTENAHGVLRFEVEELGQAKAQSERTLTSMDDRFRQALAAKEKLVVETGSSLNEAVEAKEKLAVELGALQQVNTELKSSLGEALAAKEQLAVETGSSLNEAVEAKEKLAAELGALQQVNTELKSSLSDLEEAKNNLAAEMDSSLNEAVEAKEKLAVELGALQQVNTDLKSRRNEVEEAKNNLAAAMDSSLNEAVEAKEKLAAEANALEQANADLESRRNEAVTAKKKLAAEADALTQAKTDLESNLNEAVTAKNNLAAEANALQQANADLESRRNEAVTAKNRLAAEADALTQAKTTTDGTLANVLGKLGLDERPRDSLVQRAEGLSEQIEGHKAAVQEANNKLNQLESSTSQGYSKYESQQRALLGAVRPVLTDAPQDPISAHSAKPMVAAVCALPNDHDEVEPLQLAVQDDCTLVFKSGEQHPTGSPSRLLARKLWLHACCETDDDLAVCALIDVLRARSYHTPQDPSEIGRTEGDMLVHAFRQYVARAESYASHEQHNEPSVARVCSWAAQCLELIIRYAGPLLQAEAREQYAKLSTIVAGLETPSLLLRAMMQWLQQALHAPATAVSLLHILANETDTLRGAAPTWAEYEKRVYERTVIVDGDDVLILVPDGPTVQRWPKDALAYKQPDLHVQGLYTKSSHSLANPPGVAFVTRHTGDAWWFFAEHYPDN